MASSVATPALSEHALRNSVAAGTFEPVYYLYGDDDFRKDEAITHALACAVPDAMRDFNVEVRRASDLDAEAVASLLGTPPLMSDRRAVVIREVGALRKDARRALDAYLAHPACDTVVFLTTPAGTKPDAALMRNSTEVGFPALTADRVPKWIAHRAKELGATVTPDAATLLYAAVGGDLAMLAGELDKLVSYVRGVSGSEIDEAAVSAVVGIRRGETLGDWLDRVAERDATGALALLPHVLALPKTTAVSVVMALTTQTLALAWGVARRAQGVPASRLANEYFGMLREVGNGAMTGRPWGEAVNAWARVVDRWSLEALDHALEALLKADMALKDTRVSTDEQILSSLVLTLCCEPPPSMALSKNHAAKTLARAIACALVCSVLCGLTLTVSVRAQTVPPVRPTGDSAVMDSVVADSAIRRAERLVDDGDAPAGRAVIDSLLRVVPAGTPEYANTLYVHASLATNVADAEHDYRELMVEYVSSPRAEDAMLRLAQLELARGNRAQAAEHLKRLRQEFMPRGPADARTEYEMAQAYLELDSLGAACPALASAKSLAAPTDVELLTRVRYALQRCPRASSPIRNPTSPSFTPKKPTPVPPVPPHTLALPIHGHGYTVQVAAYSLRSQADALVMKLAARGDTARVWGTVAPFRVRVGRYPTWAAAEAKRKALAAKHIEAFTTEAESQP